jgi:hypothetical protein
MASPTSGTTENPEPPRGKDTICSKGTPIAATDDIAERAYDNEQPFQGPWSSEAPPTGMLDEMTFYYGACWLHYR